MTFAQWLIENKNGKSWNKYGKERVYINVYVNGMQIDNFFYDVKTDRFFGCERNIEKSLRNEFSANAPVAENEKVAKLQKDLETYKSMLRTQLRHRVEKPSYVSLEVIEKTKETIAKLEAEIAELTKTTEEVTTEETTTEETTTEETTTEETTTEETTIEETTTEETTTEETTEETTKKVKISTSELQKKFQAKFVTEIDTKKELKKVIKELTLNIQSRLEKEEVKQLVTNKKINLFFQEQMMLLIFAQLEITNKIFDIEYFITELIFNSRFDEMIKSIKDFIKEERGD